MIPGKWNLKACHAWELILNWQSWCDTIHLHDPTYNWLVNELVFHFETIYTFAFRTNYEVSCLLVFLEAVGDFVASWRQYISGGKSRNVYHWLAVEVPFQILECGSIWEFASDVTESFVCLIKTTFLHYTNRGGVQKHWTCQVMQRILVKTLLKSISSDDPIRLFSEFEKRKFIDQYVRQHLLHIET